MNHGMARVPARVYRRVRPGQRGRHRRSPRWLDFGSGLLCGKAHRSLHADSAFTDGRQSSFALSASRSWFRLLLGSKPRSCKTARAWLPV